MDVEGGDFRFDGQPDLESALLHDMPLRDSLCPP